MKLAKTLLLINLFFLQSYLIRFDLGGYPTNLQEILIAFTAVIFIIEIIKSKRFIQTLKNIKRHWIILSFIGLTVLSLILIATGIIEISPPIRENLRLIRHSKFLFFAIILSFIFLETFKTSKQKLSALKVAGLGAIAFGLFSVIYNLLGHNIAHDLRLLGPLDAAVYLAFYLTPFFLLFSIEFMNNPKKPSNLIFAIILALFILATRSMGAIGAGFLILLLYLFIKKRKSVFKSKATKSILIIITILILGAIFYTKILPSLQSKWSSLNERGEIWQTSAHLLSQPKTAILGVGLGQFELQYIQNVDEVLGHPPLDYYVIQPHNIFLLFWFHYGILGLIFILFCIFKTIKLIIKHPKNDFTYTSLFILLYFFLHGLIDTPFFKNDLLILLILILSLTLTHSPNPPKPHKDPAQ